MIIACPNCATKFDAGAALFPAAGRKVKCARCAHIWLQGSTGIISAEPMVQAQPVMPVDVPLLPAAQLKDAPPEMIWAGSDIPRRRPGRGALVAVAFACFAVVVAGAVFFRESIARAVPATGSVYAALGMPVNTSGLDITIQARSQEDKSAGGATTLVVTGVVANVTSEERSVPRITATLLAEDKTELHSWTFDAGISSLKPGESHTFMQEVAHPPAGTYQVYAHFADSGE